VYKKTKQGIEIDSQAADKKMAPRFGKRPALTAPEEPDSKPRPAFGKKKARKSKIAAMIGKAKK
jgi:hypothetical protein